MDFWKLLIDGIWNNLFSKSVNIGVFSFPLWVPTAFGLVCALVIRFLGGGRQQ